MCTRSTYIHYVIGLTCQTQHCALRLTPTVCSSVPQTNAVLCVSRPLPAPLHLVRVCAMLNRAALRTSVSFGRTRMRLTLGLRELSLSLVYNQLILRTFRFLEGDSYVRLQPTDCQNISLSGG